MMITCKDVAAILGSDGLSSQKWMKRMEIRLHLAMCRLCSRFARQIAQLRLHARDKFRAETASPDFENRLIRHLADHSR